MASIAAEGDGPDTIGLAVLSKETERAKEAGKSALGFARMFRRPDWIGLCYRLKEVPGTVAVVVESRKEPGRIGHILCLPPDTVGQDGPDIVPDDEIPLTSGDKLTNILKWHQVGRIIWNPVESQ